MSELFLSLERLQAQFQIISIMLELFIATVHQIHQLSLADGASCPAASWRNGHSDCFLTYMHEVHGNI